MARADGQPALCLVTGATGYIGGRLTSELLACGYRVRVMVRHPERLRDHLWLEQVDVVTGDALDPASLAAAMVGVDCAYYLLHALIEGHGFEKVEDEMATNFANAARDAGVRRIVYLGGLIPKGEELSAHLQSRKSTGEILRKSGVPTAELRAGVVLGSGSASFEMLRYLTEHLPAMVTPKWVRSRIQPIAVRRVALFGWRRRTATRSQSRLRYWWPRRAHISRHDADLRENRGLEKASDNSRAGFDTQTFESLGWAGNASPEFDCDSLS